MTDPAPPPIPAAPVHRILEAACFAAQKHAGQKRKGVRQEPYVNHLLEVAELVAGSTDELDVNLIAAALLHDTIEDAGVTALELEERFGSDVASLVVEVTDDKSLPQAIRKELQVRNAPHKSPRAQTIKLADKISNLRSMLNSPPADWDFQRRHEYFLWGRRVVDGLAAPNAKLKAEFDRTFRQFQEGLYLAYELSEASRRDLLSRFPPKYSEVKADHITVKFPATPEDAVPPPPDSVRVVGYADSGDGLEARTTSLFHSTLSVAKSRCIRTTC
jgi:predicted HD phosphohydrolase